MANRFNRCCETANATWPNDAWLDEVTEETKLRGGGLYLRLYRCKFCGAHWVMRNQCEGHQQWYDYWERIDSPEAYEQLKQTHKADYDKWLEEQKEWYRLNGWEWKW